ncbi:uncharacterized protein BDW47DRAFT_38962 [Aspergillus candidus]|uniref:Uncharacterized protein n=1 Tax=Aspergillus candidus TaxID=41067 RepID=A0A2I2F9F3_ASPCN|nr:hypothetical protein BDW47DRAFT_38962 [Aspergillus candidus]PLB37262.1 hypothetical protein BDW47DRAFT_38962 [Aspergillus candidus]
MTDQPSTADLRKADYERFKDYVAYGFVLGAPILIALPPRKLDHFTALLTFSFLAGVNHTTRIHTGRSALEHLMSSRGESKPEGSSSGGGGWGMPTKRAEEIQAKLRAAREAQIQAEEARLAAAGANRAAAEEELEKLRARREQEKGVVEKVWMGGESEGWKEKRLREEQKALDEGRGYGDLIRDHIWDVWTWGKKDEGEGDEDKE